MYYFIGGGGAMQFTGFRTLGVMWDRYNRNELNRMLQELYGKNNGLQTQLNNLVVSSGKSPAEVVQARGDYELLYERLDASDERLNSFKKVVRKTTIRERLAEETDDTARLQEAFDTGGVIYFDIGKKYIVSSALNVDLSKVKGIEGNKSLIELQSEIIGLDIYGKHTGHAGGAASSKTVKNNEHHFFISGLNVTSKDYILRGTAIRLKNSYGVSIRDSSFHYLNKGIEFYGNNRNVIIESNHINHCRSFGIHYNHSNLHQSNIGFNHISYCKTNIYIENGDVHDLQIVGNDIELGNIYDGQTYLTDIDHAIHVKSYTGKLESFVISGNGIQDHWKGKGIIRFESNSVQNLYKVLITGNQISNSPFSDIYLESIKNVTITGNTFVDSEGYSIYLAVWNENINISGNSFSGGGVVRAYSALDTFSFENNTCTHLDKKPFLIDTTGLDYSLYTSQINNNSFMMVNDSSVVPPGYMFEIITRTIEGTLITGNSFRARSYVAYGMKIESDNFRKSIITNNTIFGLPTGAQYYNLPSAVTGQTIVKDNL